MGEQRRRELEAVAYGDASTAAEREAAFRELARVSRRRFEKVGEYGAEPQDPGPDAPSPRPRWRALVVPAAALAAGLFVGAGATWLVTAGPSTDGALSDSPGSATSTPAPSDGLDQDPAATSRLAAGDAPVSSTSEPSSGAVASGTGLAGAARIDAAKTLFARPRDTTDVYPEGPNTDGLFDPASTRWMGGTEHTSVFIARQKSPAGFCILTAAILADGTTTPGGVSCVPEAVFGAQGIAYGTDDVSVSWSADDITLGGDGDL